ncbi:hypothetical protein COU54_00825 [Candidatus Pacearchaeota archaeon CG10_big_fil_rev_8_21_14_0_10_31_24]|nr:MAG: hypothetical protein COU54_00825 [Candidatus Pacearchaeota archaeon CG10_big_fil_rev_8_21_14_0_10_31_24]
MIKEEDIVVCKVKSIEGATVFLEIEGFEKSINGSMMMSEVAAGRIRNLREYVFPNKKIICKVLRIASDGHPELSLRRVTGKEREETEKRTKKEKTFEALLKSNVKDYLEIIKKIKEKYALWEFVDESYQNHSLLEKYMNKEDAKKVFKLVSEKENKEKEVKKNIILKTNSESGLEDIKEILSNSKLKISYLGSSKFTISTTGKDFKEANLKLNSALEEMEKMAKDKKATLEIKEK